MKRIDLPLIADVLFYGVCAWFLSIGILRYYRIPLALSIVLASLIALAISGAVFLIAYFSHRKVRLNKRESAERDAILLHLALEKEERVNAAFLAAFTADGVQLHTAEEGLEGENTLYLPRFRMQPLSADEIALLIRRYGKRDFTVLCNALSPEAEKLAQSFGIKVLGRDEIYALFKRTDTVPKPLICAELPRKTVKKRLKVFFSKERAHPFFVSGILLLFMSLFTFFPLYYLISGSVLLLLAMAMRFFGFSPKIE